MKNFKYMIILFIALGACENEGKRSARVAENDYALSDNENLMEVSEETAMEEVNMAVPPSYNSAQPSTDRKLIKTANLSIQVDNLTSASTKIQRLIQSYNGYINNDHFENLPSQQSRNIEIRVPSDRLESLFDQLSKTEGFVSARHLNVRDVSEEYIDTEIRIKSKKAVLDQYLKLLDRATKVEDILSVENEIRTITEEIEAKEGRLRYLKDQVSLSTIHLHLYQEILIADSPPAKGFLLKAKENMEIGWDLVVSLVLGLMTIWPLILMSMLGIITFKFFKRRQMAQR